MLSQFWGLVVRGQGVSRVVPSEVQEGASVPGLFLSTWWLLAIFVFLGLETHHSDLCLHLHVAFSLCVCVQISFSYTSISPIELGPTLISMTSS